MSYLFFDTETTGLLPRSETDDIPRLVQLGCIVQDDKQSLPLSEISLLVKQSDGTMIPAEATAVHGITDAQTQRYGLHTDLVDLMFSRLLKTVDIVVAHNLEYDIAIVRYNLPKSWKVLQTKQQYCTMMQNINTVQAPFPSSKYGTNQFKYPSLSETYRYYFDTDNPEGHSAIGDSRACRSIYFVMDIH
jgi:DNA polymerase-3 subunit epsilon